LLHAETERSDLALSHFIQQNRLTNVDVTIYHNVDFVYYRPRAILQNLHQDEGGRTKKEGEEDTHTHTLSLDTHQHANLL
jgi:hypothetical protein